MKSKPNNPGQTNFLYQRLEEQPDPEHPLYRLAEKIDRDSLDQGFADFYSKKGRPAHPVRLTASLLMLKQMYDVSDEDAAARWVENPYRRFLSGTETFQWKYPVEPSDPTRFRNRIGKKGAERILKLSIDIHERKASDKEVLVNTTVREKNITYPADPELYKKAVDLRVRIAEKEGAELRRTYKRAIKNLLRTLSLRRTSKQKKAARKARRKLKTVGVSANSYES